MNDASRAILKQTITNASVHAQQRRSDDDIRCAYTHISCTYVYGMQVRKHELFHLGKSAFLANTESCAMHKKAPFATFLCKGAKSCRDGEKKCPSATYKKCLSHKNISYKKRNFQNSSKKKKKKKKFMNKTINTNVKYGVTAA
ncbi:hypothetical protein POVWA2_036980 [Plasmodium ovale wallikeri]|uniref:Uncharacterized protein n=1 Tax=Plasmodium ovale wallikeri TaxID=864142 RepID=A0A1A8Z3U2_PLAOA|nr:hypothetical protein POVWA1_038000 [Plasmodium ovale wallikeri]SBT39070.1 hypothetical protein POVWA2_036980 [Plasmodium ovale wallikeri]